MQQKILTLFAIIKSAQSKSDWLCLTASAEAKLKWFKIIGDDMIH